MATTYPKVTPVDFMNRLQLLTICRLNQLKCDASTTNAAMIALIKA